jgi:hypothetical protein
VDPKPYVALLESRKRLYGSTTSTPRDFGAPTPNEDPTGEVYAFEKGAEKTGGGDGLADVWKRHLRPG